MRWYFQISHSYLTFTPKREIPILHYEKTSEEKLWVMRRSICIELRAIHKWERQHICIQNIKALNIWIISLIKYSTSIFPMYMRLSSHICISIISPSSVSSSTSLPIKRKLFNPYTFVPSLAPLLHHGHFNIWQIVWPPSDQEDFRYKESVPYLNHQLLNKKFTNHL